MREKRKQKRDSSDANIKLLRGAFQKEIQEFVLKLPELHLKLHLSYT